MKNTTKHHTKHHHKETEMLYQEFCRLAGYETDYNIYVREVEPVYYMLDCTKQEIADIYTGRKPYEYWKAAVALLGMKTKVEEAQKRLMLDADLHPRNREEIQDLAYGVKKTYDLARNLLLANIRRAAA